ncbi:MAG: ribonuclease M5 [Heliobacteriaceae bacterium]|nr:ribonuclease M5 [Heliobacteriaceae bacterium]MDD4587620.1 ribonuclease M5 [Heliobacteriaceae bacterium]
MSKLTKERIREVIVVEGRDDLLAVKRAVDAEVIVTRGLGLGPRTLRVIAAAQQRCGVIVLTDPDGPGERIRRQVAVAVPGVKHAFLPVRAAQAKGDIGVENASVTAIREALALVRTVADREGEFTRADLRAWGLDGVPGAGRRRAVAGETLGIGRVNAKQFLCRLNHFGLGLAEIEAALRQTGEVGPEGAGDAR